MWLRINSEPKLIMLSNQKWEMEFYYGVEFPLKIETKIFV